MPFIDFNVFCNECKEFKRVTKIALLLTETDLHITLICGHSFIIKNLKIEWDKKEKD